MFRGPGAAVELGGDGFALQADVDGMPLAVGERRMRKTARPVV
jgi:hypothetical protein